MRFKLPSCLMAAFLLIPQAHAYDLGIRFNSAVPSTNTGIVQFPPGDTPGMLNELLLDVNISSVFYWEAGAGYRSPQDVFQYASYILETSAGVQLHWEALFIKFSEGVDTMPQNAYYNYRAFDFITHLRVGLKDEASGVSFSIERTHASNGQVDNNPSLNYTGFVLMLPVEF